MALPATDDFTGDNDPVTGRTGWSATGLNGVADTGESYTGKYEDRSGNSDDKAAYWDADTFANDQYSQIVVASHDTTAGKRLGPMVRTGAGNTGLLIRYKLDTANFEAYYWNGGTRTQIGTAHTPTGGTVGVGDIIRAEISGTTLTLKVDYGAGFVTETTFDASAGPSSGSAGIYIVGTNLQLAGDDWEGGNLAGGTNETIIVPTGPWR